MSFRWARANYGATQPPFYSRAVLAVTGGDPAKRAVIMSEARIANVELPSGWFIAAYTEDLPAATELTRIWLARLRDPLSRARAHTTLASFGLAGGRWRTGLVELAAAAALVQDVGRAVGAVCASLPFFPATRPEIEVIRDELARAEADASQPKPGAAPEPPVRRPLRLYLLGLLSARLGAHNDALRYAAAIERLEVPPGWGGINSVLARGVRASVAADRGNAADVLAALGPARNDIPPQYLNSLGFADAYTRWLRAEALRALGRDDDALRWYAAATEAPSAIGAWLELVLLGPSHLRRAEIRERKGDRAPAVEHYRRFRDLWADADPAGLVLVRAAAERAARLEPDPPSRRREE